MNARTLRPPASGNSLDLFASGPADPPPAARRPVASPGLPVGHPMREREMVCDLADGLGCCPVPTGALGPLDVCRRRIGTIGYQLGGVVICWSCFVRITASERAAREAALKRDASPESGLQEGGLAEVGGVLAGGAGEDQR